MKNKNQSPQTLSEDEQLELSKAQMVADDFMINLDTYLELYERERHMLSPDEPFDDEDFYLEPDEALDFHQLEDLNRTYEPEVWDQIMDEEGA